jgi:GTP cyclohydrolase FolE2
MAHLSLMRANLWACIQRCEKRSTEASMAAGLFLKFVEDAVRRILMEHTSRYILWKELQERAV